MRSFDMIERTPSVDDQQAFWDDWNRRWRTADIDEFMSRQREVALRWTSGNRVEQRILEVGCGVGWLSAAMSANGEVLGVDLSPASIELARQKYPEATFQCGDFMTLEIPGTFDCIVTADAIGHVEDHAAFTRRAAELLRVGGRLVIMTQNPFVWTRYSQLSPVGPGQIRNWPSLKALKSLLADHFRILEVSSICPAGDRGILRIANSRYVAGVLRRLIGRERATALYERMLVGRELTVVAIKL